MSAVTRLNEVIRGWLGWCPNGHAAKPRISMGAGTGSSGSVFTSMESPDPDPSPATPGGQYRHTQIGYVLLISIGSVSLFLLGMMLLVGSEVVLMLVLGIMITVLSITSTLTVTLDRQNLAIRFGPVGLIRKVWPVSKIVSAMPVTNPWYYGYGIHLTPRGTLYNVSGKQGVEILLASGTRFRIGSDEPDALCRAIREAAGIR